MSRVSGKPYCVYVLWSESSGLFYIGISEDPAVRLLQHNGGAVQGWTARHRPWNLVFTEKHPDYTCARKRENELKAQKGGRGFFVKTGLDPKSFGRKGS